MKIGVLAGGNDMLVLFRFLHRYDHEYIVRYDSLYGFWGDKSWDVVIERVKIGIQELQKQGVESFIVPPLVELYLIDKEPLLAKSILPLFSHYLKEYVFGFSLVGKIGLLGDVMDQSHAQSLLSLFGKSISLNDKQKSFKKFHQPWVWWFKILPLWKYFLISTSYSKPLVHTMIKHDLRYFKDAYVDTILPLNYGYFAFEKVIGTFFNHKKTRFHRLESLEKIFGMLVKVGGTYSVSVLATDQTDFLVNDKRLVWLLQRGKKNIINWL